MTQTYELAKIGRGRSFYIKNTFCNLFHFDFVGKNLIFVTEEAKRFSKFGSTPPHSFYSIAKVTENDVNL